MGGGGSETKTQTQTSGLSNPAFDAAATTLGNQLNTQLSGGVKPYTGSMVPGLSANTQAGIDAMANNPNNSIFMNGVTGAIGQQSAIANGQVVDDPLRQRVLNDATTASNATFASNGRFGGDTHRDDLTRSATEAVAGLDYARQQQAIQNLPGLYGASQQPGSAFLQAGSIQDAWNAANAEEQARLFDATQNSGWNTLQRGASIFAGTAPVSGTTTTGSQTTPTAPWWQQVGGYILGNASKAAGAF